VNPVELVKGVLTPDEWEAACEARREPIHEVAEQCPFFRHRLFIIYGRTGQHDFVTLPHGSYCYVAATGKLAIRLTRQDKEIQSVLRDEWDSLPNSDPVVLASLILNFFDGGIKASHHVLRNSDDLRSFVKAHRPTNTYELNEKEFAKSLESIGSTESVLSDDTLSIRAITLCGWMHRKQNLGIESLAVNSEGVVSFQTRTVLSRRIFRRVPGIRY
jgi:hypothetical protein